MKIFTKPNLSNNWKCPICNTSDSTEVTLIKIAGTEEGNICEAEQVHINCIDLVLYKHGKLGYYIQAIQHDDNKGE